MSHPVLIACFQKRAGVGDHCSPIILRAPLYINLLVTSALRAVCPQASLMPDVRTSDYYSCLSKLVIFSPSLQSSKLVAFSKYWCLLLFCLFFTLATFILDANNNNKTHSWRVVKILAWQTVCRQASQLNNKLLANTEQTEIWIKRPSNNNLKSKARGKGQGGGK